MNKNNEPNQLIIHVSPRDRGRYALRLPIASDRAH